VKTGVQEICNALKRLDSGFRRNDKLKTNPIFSHLQGAGGIYQPEMEDWFLPGAAGLLMRICKGA
jgi:hypothetical protein